MYNYKIKKFNRIVDGDTVDLDIDLGFNIVLSERIRLKDLDAPEIRTANLDEKAFGMVVKEWVEKELSRPGEWIIQTTKKDKYGRILGTIYCVGDPVTLNEKLINEGYAVPYQKKR